MSKLFQINSTANWGSTGKIAEQIGERAMSHGWESYIAYGRLANRSNSSLIRIGNRISQAWHLIISRLFDKHGLGSRCATKNLIRKIKEIKPDIIHLHNIHGYYINYKILFNYLNSSNIPIVWTLHDCWSFTGHCAHFVEASCYKWRDKCSKCPLKNKYPKSYYSSAKSNFELKRQLFSKANTTLVPASNWLSQFVDQSFLQDKAKVIIHNGINIDIFRPLKLEKLKADKRINILGVSSVWDKSKGLYDFYKLQELLDSNRYKITIVGLTQQQIEELPEGIIGIERTNSVEELVSIYNEADIFINPTYADTFPTTNLEALACGTPVITHRTGGSPESITPDTGIVVEQGDVNGIVQAIKEICAKGKEHYTTACREYAVEHFDKDKCFEKYIELYNEILNNTK
jgi:glycosyltransferase involved in cell wall biosynthesis